MIKLCLDVTGTNFQPDSVPVKCNEDNRMLHRLDSMMPLLAWIVLGLIAGFVVSKLFNGTGSGLVMDVVLGVLGAVIGGGLFSNFVMAGVGNLSLHGVLVAIMGAVSLLLLYHAIPR
ncbi:GlsB/YeaQ/YmgE family stress response membrane protein [Uliginosibacterium flavum]|uniref:GlsB/YeaQ/YmgE family stress response membrane protein n=1 Tax=Uliginosibacterium flavum TaxID=1396831 RepID=A0ABV2TJ67_9RHOO